MEDLPAQEPPAPARALFALRVALLLFALGALIGGPWDMLWHTQFAFESFFSPPHLFIYGMTAASVAVVGLVVVHGELRGAFGRGAKLPILPFDVPPALILLIGGLLVILLSGALDEMWHAAFGVDETRFSAPHAMFGWGLFVTTLGFASARFALGAWAPIKALEAGTFGFLLLAFSLYAFLLPFLVYPTEGTLEAIRRLPAIQLQPDAQHTFRIYEAWAIHRGNPAFAPLACLWCGVAIALVRGVDGRSRTMLTTIAAASALYAILWYGLALRLGTADDLRTWLPLPILAAVIALVVTERHRWTAGRPEWPAGAVFTLLVAPFWSRELLVSNMPLFAAVALLGLCLFFLASCFGKAISAVTSAPRPGHGVVLVVCLGILVPLAFGALDLYMRLATP